MTKRIRKSVFPVACLGTRFLPATKSIPKEMLTVVERPVLQHVVGEARETGIEHFIFVTGRNKAVIEDHFDIAYGLEETLQKRGKLKELQALTADLPAAGATSFTRQQAPLPARWSECLWRNATPTISASLTYISNRGPPKGAE